ncbi:EAL domain-containing protein [Caldifermentibacillus hisashii]|uniref:EAL domain-containing protein n=1 Tax=Caldifermentibacillus hisashii TaxID=996558 RepID=UPI0031B6B002
MVKTYNYEFIDKEQLKNFIEKHRLRLYTNILAQVFIGNGTWKEIQAIQFIMKELLPDVQLIGCTSSAAILDGKIVEGKTVINFTLFEHTKVETGLIQITDHDKKVETDNLDLKTIIAYTTHPSIQTRDFFNDIPAEKEVIVAGGSATNTSDKEVLVFTSDSVTSNGIVFVKLYNPNLFIDTYHNIEYSKVGECIKITEAENDRILSINNEKPIRFFEQSFGSYLKDFHQAGCELPFMFVKNGDDKLCFIKDILPDGTMKASLELRSGDELYMVYVDLVRMIDSSILHLNRLANYSVETVFTFINMRRKDLFESFTKQELHHLQALGEVSGLITLSEGMAGSVTDKTTNFSVAAIALSETEKLPIASKKDVETAIEETETETLPAATRKKFHYHFTSEMSKQLYFANTMKLLTEQLAYLSCSLEKANRMLFYDKDTELPNRLKITETVDNLISDNVNKRFAVLFIDIDRFKLINDSFGHYVGDMVIGIIANRLKSLLTDDIFIGRFAGDKFTVILRKELDAKQIMILANKILLSISEPLDYEGHEFAISASIGVSYYPDDGKDTETILRNADTAMNRAKKYGGNQIIFFASEMNVQIKYKFELENYLRRAIEKNELFLLYQPVVDLQTGRINGSEALIRWNHPNLGLISPMEFIPIAEETGLIHEIGKWVLMEGCRQNQEWFDSGYDELFISINVSARQFLHPTFVEHLHRSLQYSGMDPKKLHLELTETGMIDNVEKSIAIMKEIQNLGVKISIDDFGTGYSSLSYLKNLPIDTLKIDRSFINNFKSETVDYSIVKAIITMGNGLSVKVVAEGVETYEQLIELKKMNCDYAQGYYIEKPVHPDRFIEIINNKKFQIS